LSSCKPALLTAFYRKRPKSSEAVNHPSHYQGNKFECIDIIEDFNLGFCLGNAVKYILRAGKKQDRIQDLRKAIWYLQRECKNTGLQLNYWTTHETS